jgi:PKD repeat protein
MKKFYTFLSIMSLTGALFAQTASPLPHLKATSKIQHPTPTSSDNQAMRSVNPSTLASFWSDDFSVKTKWTINTPTGSGTKKDWFIDTIGPTGTYKIPKIKSASYKNGFATFDSDLNCSSNQVADITTATSINCATHPFVNLTFSEQYSRYTDSTFVFVSNNNTTWVKYPVNVNYSNNEVSPVNPTIVKLDISATAGSKTTVWIRFEFYSPTVLGTAAGCGYSWMIDDVSLSDMALNNITLNQAFADFSYKNGGYYNQTPSSQVAPMTFRGAIANNGSSAQTNYKLNVNISTGGSSVYNQTGPSLTSLAYRAKDTVVITTPAFTPVATAGTSYKARFVVSQTQTELPADTADNALVKTFSVSDTTYARDNGLLSSLISPNDFTGGNLSDARIGNLYDFVAAAQATSITTYLDTSSTNGTSIMAKIYLDSAGFKEIATSASYAITGLAQKGKLITLPISATLKAGYRYLAAFVTTGTTGTNKVVFGADGQTQQPANSSFVDSPTAPAAWYFIGSPAPIIWLNIVSALAPAANFLASTSACVNTASSFQDNSTNTPTSWSWTFPSATPPTSAVQNPTGVIWNTPGTYTVSLTVKNAHGTSTKTQAITVSATPAVPIITATGNVLTASTTGVTYQWSLNGSPIGAATSQTYTATVSGSYTIVVTNTGSCTATSAPYPFTVTGVNEQDAANSIRIFPNPNSGNFMLSVNHSTATDYLIEIHNALGQLISTEKISIVSGKFEKNISLSQFGTGVYFLSLNHDGQVDMKRVVVY